MSKGRSYKGVGKAKAILGNDNKFHLSPRYHFIKMLDSKEENYALSADFIGSKKKCVNQLYFKPLCVENFFCNSALVEPIGEFQLHSIISPQKTFSKDKDLISNSEYSEVLNSLSKIEEKDSDKFASRLEKYKAILAKRK